MGKTLLSITFILVISFNGFTQAWPKIIVANDAGPRKVIETYDKGYLIISNIAISNYHRYIWLIKTDIDGNTLWEKKIGEGSYRYYIDDINQTYDGGYILIFRSSKYDIDYDPVVMKLDPCAEIEWCTTLHSDGFNRGVKVIQTPDSAYLALSMYHSLDWAERVFLFKIDQMGDIIWSQLYAQLDPGFWNEEGFDLTVFPNDSSYLITGSCDYIPTGGLTAFWIKVSRDGAEQYNVVWNDSTYELNTAYQTVNQQKYYYSVGSKPYNSKFHPAIYKISDSGEKLSFNTVLINEDGASGTTLSVLNDSMFVVGGRWGSVQPSQGHCEVCIADTMGIVYNQRTLFDDLQSPRNTQITFDNKILVMCGFYVGSSWDIYFYKLNQYLEDDTLYNIQLTYDSLCPGTIISDTMTIDCDIWVDIDEIYENDENSSLKIFPNPASDRVQIVLPYFIKSEEILNGFSVTQVQHQYQGELSLAIYDVFGRMVDKVEIPSQSKSIEVDVTGMNTGLHIAVLYLNNKVIDTGKFIVK
ncbi:MAG: T9SS type A sorting domain-containing protein [Bacteroidales bacterium]|jgi:hypothetical protein|nr:T9SS type A sorting domain-containing protein [Bacteroidales bacterium]